MNITIKRISNSTVNYFTNSKISNMFMSNSIMVLKQKSDL